MSTAGAVKHGIVWMAALCVLADGLLGCKARSTPPDGGGSSPKTIHDAAKWGDREAVEEFLRQGVHVDERNGYGFTPLYWACVEGHIAIVKLLLARGADVNAKGKGGWTPLFIAAMAGHTEAARQLIDKGADINASDDDGNTVLHRAAGNAELNVVRLLLEKGANAHARNKDGETPLVYLQGRYQTWGGHPYTARRMQVGRAVMQLLRERSGG